MKLNLNKFKLSRERFHSLNTKTVIIYLSLALLVILVVTSLIFENQSDLIVKNSIMTAERKVYLIDREINHSINYVKSNENKYIMNKISSILVQGKIPRYTIFNEDGRILKISPSSKDIKLASREEFTSIHRAIFKNENEGKFFYAEIKKNLGDFTDQKEIIFYMPYARHKQNTIVIKFPITIVDLEYQMNLLYKQSILLTIGMFLLVAIIAFIYFRIVIRPIKLISDTSLQVAHGNYEVHLNIKNNDEIGILSNSFNEMVTSLKTTTGELNDTIYELNENNKLIQNELDIAKIIQEGMLPSAEKYGRIIFSAYYNALEKISGDYYDFIELPDGSIGVIIADVSGHGIHAALITIMAKFLFNTHGSSYLSPAELLSRINYEIFTTVKTGDFLSAFYLIIDPENNAKFSNAGHHAVLLYRKNGELEELYENGAYLGLIENFPVPLNVKETKLGEGDRLILYTDGITEQIDEQGNYYGKERFQDYILENLSLPIDQLVAGVIYDLNSFSNGFRQIDDHTLLILEIC